MKDRIYSFLKFNKISASQLADSLNVSRSGVSHILNGRNKPNLEFIQKMLKTYRNLSSSWLLLGEGEMLIENGEKRMIDKIRQNDSLELPFETSTQKIKKQKTDFENGIRKINKIIILYSDNSFEDFFPAQSEN